MVKQKKKSWWDRLEVPLASLALAATVFGALRKSGHLAQWQRNNTSWSAANAPGAAAGQPARKKQRLTPGPSGLQVAASAIAPVVKAATAVPAAAAHAAVASTLGRATADVAASEGRRIAAAVIASVLSPASAASALTASVPAVIVPTITGGVVAVPKAQKPVRMEGVTRPSRRAAAVAPQLQPVHRMEGITRPSRRAAAFAPQLQPVQQAAAAMQGVTGTMVPFRFRDPAYVPAPIVRKRLTVFDDDDFARKMPRRSFYATMPDDVPPVRTADLSADPSRSARQRLAGQDDQRVVIPRLPGMNDVRDQ